MCFSKFQICSDYAYATMYVKIYDFVKMFYNLLVMISHYYWADIDRSNQ